MANPVFDALFHPLAQRRDAFLFPGQDTPLSGTGFFDRVMELAAVFTGLGLMPGDRVAVQVDKSPDALALYGAAVATGVVFLPLNPAYTAHEVGYFLTDALPRLVIVTPQAHAAIAPLAQAVGAAVATLDAQGRGSLIDRARSGATVVVADRGPDDLAAILYTSGTTGRSKGAMMSHANLLTNALTLADLWQFTAEDVLLHALPIFHTHGLFVATNVCLAAGASMIFLPGFDRDAVFRHLPQATAMMGVPTFYTRLLDDKRLTRDATAHIRVFISGSAPLMPETHARFAERTGQVILERYGMTETNMITSNPYRGERRPGSVGFPLPGVSIRLMDGDAPVAPGSIGQIHVKGPNVFRGYWKMPEKTAEELSADGWFQTGDLGRQDEDGYLHIVGRAKDLIISGGFNVYPKEVEEALDAVPGVLESAVIGLSHPDFGEAVFAVLTLTAPDAVTPEAALAALGDRLARFKQPKAAVVIDALPRNAMGKVQKAELRNRFAGWFKG